MGFKIVRDKYFPAPGAGPAAVEQVNYERLYRTTGSRLHQDDDDQMVLTLSFDPIVPFLPRIDFPYELDNDLNDYDNAELARLWRAFLGDEDERLICERLRKPLYEDELSWLQTRFHRWLLGRAVAGRAQATGT
jgi:hypothetical protein